MQWRQVKAALSRSLTSVPARRSERRRAASCSG